MILSLTPIYYIHSPKSASTQAGGMQVISSGLHLALTDLITKLYGMSLEEMHEIICNTVTLWFKRITNEAASDFFF